MLTGFGRLSLVERIAKRLPDPPPVIELDVTDAGQLGSLAERVGEHLDGLDGVVHAIGYAPQAALGGNFLATEWPDVPPRCRCPPTRSRRWRWRRCR